MDKIMLYDDTDSVGYFYSDTVDIHLEKLDVVINEVMWMGSSRSIHGEWIELLNRSGKDIDLSRCPLSLWGKNPEGNKECFFVLDTGVFKADSFFVVAKRPALFSRLLNEPDFIFPSLRLSDNWLKLWLYDRADTLKAWLVDEAGNGSYPIGGRLQSGDSIYWSMSRNDPPEMAD